MCSVVDTSSATARPHRSYAYQALALFTSHLGIPHHDFPERSQISALLAFVRNSITNPVERLPAYATALAAEASLLLLAPSAAMYGTLQRLLLRQPALDVSGLTLFGGLTIAGGAAQRPERRWLMGLLWMGLRVSAVVEKQ